MTKPHGHIVPSTVCSQLLHKVLDGPVHASTTACPFVSRHRPRFSSTSTLTLTSTTTTTTTTNTYTTTTTTTTTTPTPTPTSTRPSLTSPFHIARSNHDRIHTRAFHSRPCLRQDSFWRRLRQSCRGARTSPAANGDHLPLTGFLDDTAGLGGRIVKPSNDLKLRCTEFDESGNVTLVNGEFRKSELIQKYSLLPRDLRKIDSSVLPHILVRPSAILINLLHLRCLIKHNRVLVFDVYGSTDSYAQSLFMYDLEGKLRQRQATSVAGNLPYEFRALEAVLISVTSGLESEFETVREPVVRVLRELEEDIDRDKLRHLLIYSKKLGTFEQKARLVRDAIDDLLEADDDLAAMYLSEKAAGTEREDHNHEEIELLLESYHKVTDEIVQVSSNIVSAIRNTEEIVRAILDANRNSLMLLDLKFSIGTLGISAGMFIAALYGMNLENFIEESNIGFFGVTATSTMLSIAACWWGLKKLRKVQRLSMWGEGKRNAARRPRGRWNEVEATTHTPAEKPVAECAAGIKKAEGLKLWQNALNERDGEAKSSSHLLALRTTK
jgi:magnesium transporter